MTEPPEPAGDAEGRSAPPPPTGSGDRGGVGAAADQPGRDRTGTPAGEAGAADAAGTAGGADAAGGIDGTTATGGADAAAVAPGAGVAGGADADAASATGATATAGAFGAGGAAGAGGAGGAGTAGAGADPAAGELPAGEGARRARAERAVHGTLSAVLILEALTVLLVPRTIAPLSDDGLTGGQLGFLLGLAGALVAASGLQRRRAGRVLGSVLQVPIVAAGFLIGVMFALGVLFAVVWTYLLRLRRELLGTARPPAAP